MKEHMQRDQKEWTKEEGFDYHLVDNRKIIKKAKMTENTIKDTNPAETHTVLNTAQPPCVRACVHLFMFLFI